MCDQDWPEKAFYEYYFLYMPSTSIFIIHIEVGIEKLK